MILRTMFWRILAIFWLAIFVVAGLTFLLARVLNQDAWILARYPGLNELSRNFAFRYEMFGEEAAQGYLIQRKRRFRIDIQVIGENGQPVVDGTFPARAAALEERVQGRGLPWRRVTEEYTSPNGSSYLFVYRIPYQELEAWYRTSLFWPISVVAIALIVLTLFSLMLTLTITRPINRLRRAVHDLGRTAYQQDTLSRLARRRDELGILAGDFNRMGERLQGLIGSQRQLLRDVSHELRSPLARLRIALALAERATDADREKLWPRLAKECDRLEALIAEILTLARLDADPGAAHSVTLRPLLEKIREDARITAPEQEIVIEADDNLTINGWPDMIERAVDNLLRNALRFNDPEQPIVIRAAQDNGRVVISVRDHGPGVPDNHLGQLGEPFFRVPDQVAPGHGLGLAIARRAAQRHRGELILGNHPDGGFIASLMLHATAKAALPKNLTS